MIFSFKKFLNFANPEPQIGGLEISDAYVRFIQFKNDKAKIISVKLPQGVVEDGKIKDKGQLFLVLSNLHNQLVFRKRKRIYAILSISDINVYTEIFYLPKAAESDLNQAANLNLQMISPIDFNNAYHDWQTVGERPDNGSSQLEILSAFISKSVVNEFEEVINKSGFDIAAVEFPSLALVRALAEMGEGVDKNKNYLLMKIGGDGICFAVLKNGNLYFLHFISWTSVYGQSRQVTVESLKNLTVSEIQKMLSFYETHWNEPLAEMLLVSSTLREEIIKIIGENFPSLSVKTPILRQFKNLEPSWFSVIGSALRGLTSRSDDIFISLAASGTEEKFRLYQVVSFIKLWRNVILTFLGAIIIFFGGLDFILARNNVGLQEKIKDISINPEFNSIIELRKEAESFNQKVSFLAVAAKNRNKFSPFIKQITGLSEPSSVLIKRIFVQSVDSPVLLVGEAGSEDKITNFKKNLETQDNFSNINFQLPNFSQTADKIIFSITLNVNNLK